MDLILSAFLALLIHTVPVALKIGMDPLYRLNSAAMTIVLALTLFQAALLLLPGKKGRSFALLLSLPLIFTTLLNIISLIIFTSPVSLSGVFAILQSNSEEAAEFAAAYSGRIAWTTALVVLTFAICIKVYWVQPVIKGWKKPLVIFFLALAASLPLLHKALRAPTLAAWDLHEVTYADRLITSLVRYRGQMLAWETERRRWQDRGNMEEMIQLQVADAKKLAPLVVVVIGESTTRHNMQIYGYHRPTTPKLSQMKDDLIFFDDVITPAAHTIPAVMSALCSQPLKNGEINCTSATLVDIAHAAGYHVTWISNQTSVGFDDNVLVHLAKSADQAIFVNKDSSSAAEADRNTSLDEKIFAPLDSTMASAAQSGQKTMIFVHLMGAHFTYEKRYPQEAKIFADSLPNELNALVKDEDASLLINNYDNAIAYQDDVLSRIFTRIKTANRDALGIFFSDHGEEVYSSANFHGHNDMNLTASMSEIPLIVGVSDVYRRNHRDQFESLRAYQKRPFITSRLTPSIADLLGITYLTLDRERSLFSSHFKPETRMTAKGPYVSPADESFGQR